MLSDLSLQPFCQQYVPSSMRVSTHVPSSSIFGPLKGLSPYLLTHDWKIVRH